MASGRVRAGIRGHVTQEWNKINATVQDPALADVETLRQSISKLREYRLRLENLDEKIIADTEAEKLDAEVTATLTYTDNLLSCIELAQSKMNEAQKAEDKAQAIATAQAVAAATPAAVVAAPRADNGQLRPPVNLPKLQMTKFKGDILQWVPFWDFYKTAIHENATLKDIEKFNYLVSTCLTGEPLSLATGYSLTENNYSEVIGALQDRYGNPQRARFAHFDALFELKQARDDLSDLQRVYDDCEKHIRSLKALAGEESWEDVMNEMFVRLILNKLPTRVKTDISRRTGAEDWTLANLRENLKIEISARDMGKSQDYQPTPKNQGHWNDRNQGNQNRGKPNWQQRGGGGGYQGNRYQSTSTMVNNDRNNSSCIVWCTFCRQEGHYPDDCPEYTTIQARKAVIGRGCFICLAQGHQSRNCEKWERPCYHCRRTGHHQSLCASRGQPGGGGDSRREWTNAGYKDKPPRRDDRRNDGSNSGQQLTANVAVAHQDMDADGLTRTTLMQTAVTTFQNTDGTQQVKGRLLMDTASCKTYITRDMCQRLKLRTVGSTYQSVSTFGTDRKINAKVDLVKFCVVCTDGQQIEVVACVTPVISSPVFRAPMDVKRVPVIGHAGLADPPSGKAEQLRLDVLIGADYYYDFVTAGDPWYISGGMVLICSKLGFLTSGTTVTDERSCAENTLALLSTEATLHMENVKGVESLNIERFWKIEEVGQVAKDVGDEAALQRFEETVKFEDGRYAVQWPWKTENPELPDNYRLALGRLRSLYDRLKQNPEMMTQYNDIIMQQKEKSIIEEAPQKPDGLVNHMPHHVVLKPGKTTAVRVVYDASAKVKKNMPSLNECMYRGPVIMDDLCGLLLRVRCWDIALVSDIEKAFLQIRLQKSERDVSRFLWLKDITKPPVGSNVIVYRYQRVFFGNIASPFLLAATIQTHLKHVGGEIADKIRGNLYVDNIITGENDVEKAVQHYQQAKSLFLGANMNLREFYTNSPEVRAALAESDRGKSPDPKILGIRWNTEKDTLTSSGMKKESTSVEIFTKRVIVRRVAQIFDPCGWFAPVVVSGRIVTQECWRKKLGWDEPVPGDLLVEWGKVARELERIPEVSVPRCLQISPDMKLQIHTFCDSSTKASAAAVYLRKESSTGEVTCDLLFAKTRLAPIDPKQTIPRLELVAVQMGAKTTNFVVQELRLPIEKVIVWSDNQPVLHWLRKDKFQTKFAENRVNDIRQYKVDNFMFVPGTQNPADYPTKGISLDSLAQNSVWWHGPPWLAEECSSWPDQTKVSGSDLTETVTQLAVVQPLEVNHLVDLQKISSLGKLLRVTAYVRRFIFNARCSDRSQRLGGRLRVSEIGDAQRYWEITVQKEAFPDLHGDGQRFAAALKRSSISQLGVFRERSGLLRCSGRLEGSTLPYGTRNPILLPKGHMYTRLVIEYVHKVCLHAGVSQTLVALRQSHWILHGRSQVKQIIRQCGICRRVDGGAYVTPSPPDLPWFRVREHLPFAYTGLDYMGPLLVKVSPTEKTKVWICLFTCALTRAVHLELVESQSADDFQMALRRFCATYGSPTVVVSDNASQFHTVDEAMTKMWKEWTLSEATIDFAVSNNVEWKYIPEVSPWMGGFYERLIGVVKKHLKKALRGLCLSSSEMRTVITEIAFVVNSRPLLYVEDSAGALQLCPNDLLGRARKQGIPTFEESEIPAGRGTTAQVISHWKRLQAMTTNFCNVWRQAYLTSLREKHSNAVQRNPSFMQPAVGSVVLIKDKMPRGLWKLGKIEKLNYSHDGKVRTVELRLVNGRNVTRPIKLLYPLEMAKEPTTNDTTSTNPLCPVWADEPDNQDGFIGFTADDVEETADLLDRYDNLIQNDDEPDTSNPTDDNVPVRQSRRAAFEKARAKLAKRSRAVLSAAGAP